MGTLNYILKPWLIDSTQLYGITDSRDKWYSLSCESHLILFTRTWSLQLQIGDPRRMLLSKVSSRAVGVTFNLSRAGRCFGSQTTDRNQPSDLKVYNSANISSHCDVAIIGGGAVGSSIAYWLKKRAGDGLKVAVVEKDKCVSFFFKQNSIF